MRIPSDSPLEIGAACKKEVGNLYRNRREEGRSSGHLIRCSGWGRGTTGPGGWQGSPWAGATHQRTVRETAPHTWAPSDPILSMPPGELRHPAAVGSTETARHRVLWRCGAGGGGCPCAGAVLTDRGLDPATKRWRSWAALCSAPSYSRRDWSSQGTLGQRSHAGQSDRVRVRWRDLNPKSGASRPMVSKRG